MAKKKLTKRLPQARVSQELYDRVQAVAQAQDMSLADVQRAALEFYCTADIPEKQNVKIPIVGVIQGGQVIPYRRAA